MNEEMFNIDPEGLEEKGNFILSKEKEIEEALQEIDDAKKLLEGWVSPNKDRYEAKVNNVLPKMQEMINSLKMYGTVATNAAERVKNSENIIASKIENNFEG